MLHVLGDLLQSAGIVVVACLIYFNKNLTILDPILTIFFSIVMFVTSFPTAKAIMNILMEATPDSVNLDKIKESILSVTV